MAFHKILLAAKLFSTLIIIKMFLGHIRMISEGSCDSEDWRNNAENSALTTRINYFLKCNTLKQKIAI